jgi:hypothetical protein
MAFFGVLFLAFYPRKSGSYFLTAALGGMIGTAALLWLYWCKGTLDIFFESIFGHTGLNTDPSSFRANLAFRAGGALSNSTFHVLIICSFALFLMERFLNWKAQAKMLAVLWVTIFLFPVYMVTIGMLHGYYSWMVSLPVSIILLSTVSSSMLPWPTRRLALLMLLVASACVATSHVRKLPWALRVREERITLKEQAREFVRRNVANSDVAVVEGFFWHDTVTIAKDTYSAWQAQVMSPQEAAKATVLILNQEKAPGAVEVISYDAFCEAVGHGWRKVDWFVPRAVSGPSTIAHTAGCYRREK